MLTFNVNLSARPQKSRSEFINDTEMYSTAILGKTQEYTAGRIEVASATITGTKAGGRSCTSVSFYLSASRRDFIPRLKIAPSLHQPGEKYEGPKSITEL